MTHFTSSGPGLSSLPSLVPQEQERYQPVPLLLPRTQGDTVLSTHTRRDGHPCNLLAKLEHFRESLIITQGFVLGKYRCLPSCQIVIA